MIRTKPKDFGDRLAQEIIQFARSNNLKIRKKNRPSTSLVKNAIRK